jgi:hypothetical protein
MAMIGPSCIPPHSYLYFPNWKKSGGMYYVSAFRNHLPEFVYEENKTSGQRQ